MASPTFRLDRKASGAQWYLAKKAAEGGSAPVIDEIREKVATVRATGLARIKMARVASSRYAGTTRYLMKECEVAHKMVIDSTVHGVMLDSEMKAVYEAMRTEPRGTGHCTVMSTATHLPWKPAGCRCKEPDVRSVSP